MVRNLLALFTLLVVIVPAGAGQPLPGQPGKAVKAAEEIRGKFEDDKDLPKMKAAPKDLVIADAATFGKLWTEWKGNAVAPKIDFKKQLVMVGTTQCAANRVFGNFSVTEAGDLRGVFGSTLIGGPGFAWVMYVIDREGIKTVNGKPLP